MVWMPDQQIFNGHYTIVDELGEGGFGKTYLATNLQGKQEVIKTLNDKILYHPNRDKLTQAFYDEANHLFKLHQAHQNNPWIRHVVQVTHLFREGDVPCFAMEYLDGESLADRLSAGVIPEADAVRWIEQVGRALELVHREGVLHRDIKPENIMLRSDGSAVLIDFGIAREFRPELTAQTHTVMGSEGYAPPEQHDERAQRGPFTDVYALAATLYELLSRVHPQVSWARLQKDEMQPLQLMNLGVSDRVCEAVMEGLRLDGRLRPQSVGQWLGRLLGEKVTPNEERTLTLSGEQVSLPPNSSDRHHQKSIFLNVQQNIVHKVQDFGRCLVRLINSLQTMIKIIVRVKWYYPVGLTIILVIIFFQQPITKWVQSVQGNFINLNLPLIQAFNGFSLERMLESKSNNNRGQMIVQENGKLLADLNKDSIKIWNFYTGELLTNILVKELRPITSSYDEIIAISPDFKYLISRHDSKNIIWELPALTEKTLEKPKKRLLPIKISENDDIQVSSDFKYLITRKDQEVSLWNWSRPDQLLGNLILDKGDIVKYNDKYLIAHNYKNLTVKLWDLENTKKILSSRKLSSEGNFLERRNFCSSDNVVCQINTLEQDMIYNLENQLGEPICPNKNCYYDERSGYIIQRNDFKILNLRTNEEYYLKSSQNNSIIGDKESKTFYFDKEHKQILGIQPGSQPRIRIYRLRDGVLTATIQADSVDIPNYVKHVQTSLNGQRLFLFACESNDASFHDAVYVLSKTCYLTVHNLQTAESLALLKVQGNDYGDNELYISHDRKVIAINSSMGNGSSIQLLDLNSGILTHHLKTRKISSISFSSDNKYLFAQSDNGIEVWKLPK
ncbi:WD40 repeat domain-containing serine/threonine protein kinase [Alkalinema sp. FACHB-956]|uniref:WD40 repeat domain-containing serine/threonine protein kinase n=1 Tax=Alkalinema sp. FACHB-956 TaxID=2692768 RepID=UPI001686D7B4|nr:WD40 repeat domain-containing serine/threonine protein kinase [Alkalinema sp. FACHB-956]MBD2327570.1 protein kinase [Alkalinema sp. FACHB-956]